MVANGNSVQKCHAAKTKKIFVGVTSQFSSERIGHWTAVKMQSGGRLKPLERGEQTKVKIEKGNA